MVKIVAKWYLGPLEEFLKNNQNPNSINFFSPPSLLRLYLCLRVVLQSGYKI